VPGAAARDAIVDVTRGKLGRGRDDDGPEAHRREHGDPERRRVGEHQEDAVAARDAAVGEEAGDAARAVDHLGERERLCRGAVGHDAQRGAFVALGEPVEPVVDPVPGVELGPAKQRARPGGVAVATEEKVAGLLEGLSGAHGPIVAPRRPRVKRRAPLARRSVRDRFAIAPRRA